MSKTIRDLRITSVHFKPYPRKRTFKVVIEGCGECIPYYEVGEHTTHPVFAAAQVDDMRMAEILEETLKIYKREK